MKMKLKALGKTKLIRALAMLFCFFSGLAIGAKGPSIYWSLLWAPVAITCLILGCIVFFLNRCSE